VWQLHDIQDRPIDAGKRAERHEHRDDRERDQGRAAPR